MVVAYRNITGHPSYCLLQRIVQSGYAQRSPCGIIEPIGCKASCVVIVAPARVIPNDLDDAPGNSLVVHTPDTPRLGEQVLDAFQVLMLELKQMRHGQSTCRR